MATTTTNPVLQHIRSAVLWRESADLTDGQLLKSFVGRRDTGALEVLIRRHAPMVWGVCRRILANRQDAEDAFQATFLVLVRRARVIWPRELVANWLYGVARQSALKARANMSKRRVRERNVETMPEPAMRKSDDVWPDLKPLLDEELSQLPEKYRAAIVLCDLEGKTRKEAAKQLGVPDGTLAARVARGRTMLAKRLARRGLAVPGGVLAVILSEQAASAGAPTVLVSSIIKASILMAWQNAAAGNAISAHVLALSEAIMKTMSLNRFAKVSAMLLVLATVGSGVLSGGWVARSTSAEEPRPVAFASQSEENRAPTNKGFDKRPAASTGADRLQHAVGADMADGDKADSSRAEKLKALQDEFKKASDEMGKAIRAGKIKPNDQGEYREWVDLQRKTLKPVRELIDADPGDAVGLDALVFALNDLDAGTGEPGLYKLIVKYHASSKKIDPLLRRSSAPLDFLQEIAAQTTQPDLKLWAKYHLGEKLYSEGKSSEAERILEPMTTDPTAKQLGGYILGTLSDSATRLLFEIRHLNVGQEAPEVSGKDLDGKPMKLSESRGKVTLVVFWATWCQPCMAMVKHERELHERFAERPFTIVGVDGDYIADDDFKLTGADGKVIDNTAAVRAAIEKNGMKWRSFRNGSFTIAAAWNVRSWPTIYLLDHKGVIRGKWKGDPGKNELDTAVEKLMQAAETDKEDPADCPD